MSELNQDIREELKYLLEVKREDLIKRIEEARKDGKALSDYEAYNNIFDECRIVENRIKAIRKILNNVKPETQDDIEEYIDLFKEYHISDIGKDVLRGYFRYLTEGSISKTPYHFIIQADNEATALNVAKVVCDIRSQIFNRSNKATYFREYDFLDKPATDEWGAAGIVVVYDCLKDSDYYLEDEDSSTVRECKKDYDNRWVKIMNYFNQHPLKLFILCGTPDIIQGRIKRNSRMYYQFFKNKIFVGGMTTDEIYEKMMDKIETHVGLYTDDFEDKFKEYIYTVYPKADLRDQDFVDDLYHWMVMLTYRKYDKCRCFGEYSIPFYHRNVSVENLNNEFNELVGLDSVKEDFKDIIRMCQNMSDEKPYLHLVFRGNPGTGKTTVARFIARLFNSMGIIRKNHVEEVMISDLLGQYVGQTAPKVERVLERAEGGVLVIDEAYLLNPEGSRSSYREECMGTLIKAMEKKYNPVIIFAGYPKEMDDLLKSNPGLKSRIGKDVLFEDYSEEELVEIFKSLCAKSGYEYDERTLTAVERKLVALKYEDNFGNARTVESIFGQAVGECVRNNPNSKFISEEHIKITKGLKTVDELLEELNSMVGIEGAKTIIKEQILSSKFSIEHDKMSPSSNNMVFVGSAGTGKTTTAKIFSEMLFSIGASKSPRAKMITAKDLYVKDVAKKLNEYCKEVMGGVLFIDEIYLLQTNIYLCTEVISVLLELLEDKKEDITIVLAGYPEQMSSFLDENQGLKSRFPITVTFDDFTEKELREIFIQNCEKGVMKIDDDGIEQFNQVIKKEMKKGNFGNGRTVRNIYEQAYRRHAVRFYENDDVDPDLISSEDIMELTETDNHTKEIGFKR